MRSLAWFVVAWCCGCSAPAPGSLASSSAAGEGGTDGAGGQAGAGAEAGRITAAGEGGAASDEEPPHVVQTVPVLDDTEVYPAPLWSGTGEEVVVEVSFSRPMERESGLSFESNETSRPATVTWSADATKVRVVARPDFTFPRPLEDHTTYWLDLSALVSRRGMNLEPDVGLRGGRLVFTTGSYDAVLNHSCGHTFFGPFASFGAATAADEAAPDISTTHTEYSVTLPDRGGDYGGWLRANFMTDGHYRLYFDAPTRVSSTYGAGDATDLMLLPTPLACPGIALQVTFAPPLGQDVFFHLETTDSPLRRVIVELLPSEPSAP